MELVNYRVSVTVVAIIGLVIVYHKELLSYFTQWLESGEESADNDLEHSLDVVKSFADNPENDMSENEANFLFGWVAMRYGVSEQSASTSAELVKMWIEEIREPVLTLCAARDIDIQIVFVLDSIDGNSVVTDVRYAFNDLMEGHVSSGEIHSFVDKFEEIYNILSKPVCDYMESNES